MDKKWVQHKSGQGEKWEVGRELPNTWATKVVGPTDYYLPKSEYIECEGPEEWEDVTGDVQYEDKPVGLSHLVHNGKPVFHGDYRLRKVDLLRCEGHPLAIASYKTVSAFIVERKK